MQKSLEEHRQTTSAFAAPSAPKLHAHRVVKLLAGVLCALLLVYLGASFYFMTHFVPGTTVNDYDVSLLSLSDAAERLEDTVNGWSCHISSRGGFALDLNAQDLKFSVDGQSVSREAKAQQQPFFWPYTLLHPQTIEIEHFFDFDVDALSDRVQRAIDEFNRSAEAPTNAHAGYDDGAKKFIVSADSLGTALDNTKSQARIQSAVSALAHEVSLGADELLAPTTLANNSDLVAACEQVNAILAQKFELVQRDTALATISKKQLASWISIDENNQLSYDRAAIDAWNTKKLGEDTVYEDDDAFYELDHKATVDAIIAACNAGKSGSISIALNQTASKPAQTPGAAKRGRHLDVNLTSQFARFYNHEGKIVWDSYIRSGDLATKHGTPTGDFSLLGKERDSTLIGFDENKDGKPDYKSPVKYWMPFRAGGYGLHDAPWVSYFGGDAYEYAGSHGCINLPTEKAAALFDLIEVGDPVIVHW